MGIAPPTPVGEDGKVSTVWNGNIDSQTLLLSQLHPYKSGAHPDPGGDLGSSAHPSLCRCKG